MRAGYSKDVTGDEEYCVDNADRCKIVQEDDTGADEDVFEAGVVYHDCWCSGL